MRQGPPDVAFHGSHEERPEVREQPSALSRSEKDRRSRVFTCLWLGQTVSLMGSALTSFALGIWVYRQTGSVNRFAIVSLSGVAPVILLSPLLGMLVDRWDRRWVMIASDAGAGLCTLGLALAFRAGGGAYWQLCLFAACYGACGAVTPVALSASIPLLVTSERLDRANGMVQLSGSLVPLVAPLLGGVLLGTLGMRGILLIDFVTFVSWIGVLLLLRLPRPESLAQGDAGSAAKDMAATGGARGRPMLHEAMLGWKFVRARPAMLNLLALLALVNLAFDLVSVLINPLVLSFASSALLGVVVFVAGLGVVAGGLLMTVWRGPAQRLPAILWLIALEGIVLLLGGARPSLWLIGGAGFLYLACHSIISVCSQTLWQRKVPAALQGRVFAIRQMLASSALPAGYLLAGPLADRVFEPLLAPGGPLAGSLGPIVGVGQGRGIGLMFMCLGVVLLLSAAVASRVRALRHLERLLPDVLPDPA
jgi:MFS transporter, DHA3 family, macrolide efflux protein